MLRTVEGVYRQGKIELLELGPDVSEARVIVTFLDSSSPDAPLPKLTLAETVDLRGKLAAWEEDWNAPGMEAYDAL